MARHLRPSCSWPPAPRKKKPKTLASAKAALVKEEEDGMSGGEFELDECLRVDDQLSDVLVPQPPEGTTYTTLTGVLTYTYGHAKLEPRGSEDVVD